MGVSRRFFGLYPEADDTVFLERGELGIVLGVKEEKQLLAVDLSTGQERWRISLEQNDDVQDDVLVTASSPREDTFDVLSYLVNKHRLELHRYDVNGELQKTLTLSRGVPLMYTSLLLGAVSDDKHIYVALSNEEHPSIIKADLETGETLLELKDEFGELFLGPDALYVKRSETLLALNKETLGELWQVSAGNRRFEKLLVDKNIYLLYTINEEGEEDNMLALSLEGEELWSSSVTGGIFNLYKQIPALIPGGVVTVDSYGTEAVFAFSEEGQELWRFPGEVLSGSASSDGENVYVTTRDPRW